MPTNTLHIELHVEGARVERATLISDRPLTACALLEGMTAQEAVSSAPALFSVCGRAQGIAARRAVGAAQGTVPGRAAARRDEGVVLAEVIVEFLWRLAIDLPRALDIDPTVAAVAPLSKHLRRAIKRLDQRWLSLTEGSELFDEAWWSDCRALADQLEGSLSEHVFGVALEGWPTLTSSEELEGWCRRAQTAVARALAAVVELPAQSPVPPAPLLRIDPAAAWVRAVAANLADDPRFVGAPHLDGVVHETGPLATMRRDPLVTLLYRSGRRVAARLVARLVALVKAASTLRALDPTVGTGAGRAISSAVGGPPRVHSATLGAGVGVSWLDSARGLLVHRVALAGDGSVGRYQILAPTEWNCQPGGVLVGELEQLTVGGPSALERRAALSVIAVDPCVAFDLAVIK